jgi:hypothetical protein
MFFDIIDVVACANIDDLVYEEDYLFFTDSTV